MNILRILKSLFTKKTKSVPLQIIKKKIVPSQIVENVNLNELDSIEEAITDLENDPNLSE
ncbi:MAG: hypothetical protein COW71_12160 [Ignavibacteriales bacterium CG18_big_fil_WC_8_21_14_2_50_31_20]|nr:MAG: hypothetical protein COW71_12160 [Ignavibacteriales bacterium CG18_big_fil_WC_8_21_14_2_50_31_20]